MNSSRKLRLLSNIAAYNLDSRIGKALLSAGGTSTRMGERISARPGSSPVIIDRRYYEKGDSLKDIDWKLSARTEKLFVKIREGYRQTDFIIVPDCSSSMKADYGSKVSKFITGLTIAYIAGMVALKSMDRVFISYSDEKIRVFSGHDLVDTLLQIESGEADYAFWYNRTESSANIFLLSDFFVETGILTNYLKDLRHKIDNFFMISIHDPFETNLDIRGRYKFLDTESDASVLAEAGKISDKYHHLYNEHYHAVAKIGKSFGARMGKVSTNEDPYNAFVRTVS